MEVEVEVTAAEGAPDDTGIDVDNDMSVMLDDLYKSMPYTYTSTLANLLTSHTLSHLCSMMVPP